MEEIDTIIYCTGYDISFPFLADGVLGLRDNNPALYRRVAAPDRPGLYFIGLVQPLGAIMPLAEAQSHWVADLIQATAPSPTASACTPRSTPTAPERPAVTWRPPATRSRWMPRRICGS